MTATFDSSAWAELFSASKCTKPLKEVMRSKETVYTSALSILEVRVFCDRMKQDWKAPIEFIRKRSKIVPADENICIKAAEVRQAFKLHTVDAIIYATALQTGTTLYTKDGDFENVPGVQMLSE